jgi:hypothetical protein
MNELRVSHGVFTCNTRAGYGRVCLQRWGTVPTHIQGVVCDAFVLGGPVRRPEPGRKAACMHARRWLAPIAPAQTYQQVYAISMRGSGCIRLVTECAAQSPNSQADICPSECRWLPGMDAGRWLTPIAPAATHDHAPVRSKYRTASHSGCLQEACEASGCGTLVTHHAVYTAPSLIMLSLTDPSGCSAHPNAAWLPAWWLNSAKQYYR